MAGDANGARARPSVFVTVMILFATVPFMAGLFWIYKLLHVQMPFFGVLFLLYWAAMLHQNARDYVPSVLGGLAGILLGWMLVAAPVLYGPAGGIVAYAMLAALLFCYTRGQARLIANNATLLFVIGAASPEFRVGATLYDMVVCLLVAAAYMGVVSLALRAVARRRRARTMQLNAA